MLASSALRGLELARGLQTGALLRRRYSFSTEYESLAQATPLPTDTVPFFTLRRPLARGEVRRLNLFEPRWLCLLDGLAAAATADIADGDGEDALGLEVSERLLNATFGCVFAVNRYYTTEEGSELNSTAAPTTRVADMVLRPIGRRARIVRAAESTRPVSGGRRLEVWIRGEEALRIDAASLKPTQGGYLAARVAECTEAELCVHSTSEEDSATSPVRVVSVVGLAHANGVLDRCAHARLCDGQAMARAALEEPE